MQTRSIALLAAFVLSLLCIACKRNQPSPAPADASQVLPASVTTNSAASSVEPALPFTGEIVRNEHPVGDGHGVLAASQ